jgi:transcriptional regulator with XRE-family HTH domain
MENINQIIEQTRTQFYAWLKSHKITQEFAAEQLDVSRSHLNKVLNGTTPPSIYLLQKMITYMNGGNINE